MADQFLYGLPGAEVFYTDPVACFEAEIDPCDATRMSRTWIIEKWTAEAARDYLPDVETLAEWIAERGAEDMGSEEATDQWYEAAKDHEVVAALNAASELLASKVAWLMCGEQVGTYTVTWAEDGSPLLDGQPMYVKRQEADHA